jgi:hypothetical protein
VTEYSDQSETAAADGNEVVKRAGKRQFSAAYRIRIVEDPYGARSPGR